MSRPVILATLAFVAGVVVADELFYYAAVAVPHGLGPILLGVCAVLALLAVWDYRQRLYREGSTANFMAVVVALFCFILGFHRYAFEAERTQAVWQLMEQPPTNRGNPDEFDYRRWRWLQGEPDSTTLLATARRRALNVREQWTARYQQAGLQDQTLAVVTAMTLGDRSLLTAEIRERYAEAGAAHLLALSGLHLGVITGVFVLLLNSLFLRSRWRWPVALLLVMTIWGYAFVAALPTSLVRAAVMCTLLVLTSLSQRRTSTLNLLLLTALLMLFVWPLYLFDLGAQLSFLSVAGIALMVGPAYRWLFRRWRSAMFWCERYYISSIILLLLVSLSAQLFTLPLVMVHFHRIPLYGPLFSLLLIPLTTLLVYLSMAVLLVGGIWLAAGHVLAMILTWIVSTQLWVMRVEMSLPGASIPDFWSQRAEPQLVIYHSRACPTLHLIAAPHQSWLLSPTPERVDSALFYIRRDFWNRRLTAPPQLLNGRHAVATHSFTAVMVDANPQHSVPYPQHSPLPHQSIDVLWITRGYRGASLSPLIPLYCPRLLVLDASLPRWQRQALLTEARHAGWPVYDIAKQGALRLKLGE